MYVIKNLPRTDNDTISIHLEGVQIENELVTEALEILMGRFGDLFSLTVKSNDEEYIMKNTERIYMALYDLTIDTMRDLEPTDGGQI